MASNRFRSRKTLTKSLDRVSQRLKYLDKRTTKTRLKPRVVTTKKMFNKTVTTPKIAENAVTTETIAPGAVTVDQIDFNAGDIGGSTSYVQTSAPVNPNVGDLWFDTDDDNNLKQWSGTAWISVRDLTIAVAQNAANAAQTTADGKNKIYRQATSPALTGNAVGDLWFDTANGNRIARWDGTAWTAYGLGNAAIANLDAGKITTGSLDAGRIAANTINASMIVAGAITGTKIAADAIDGKTITGATLQTSNAASGKIIIDSTNGFRAINSTGSTTVSITTAGVATFNGSVTATSFSATGLVSNSDLATSSVTSVKIADGTIGTAKINFDAGDIGGSTSYVQIAAPTSPNVGDLWFDSDDNNSPKQWNGTAWINIRDLTIAVAQNAANAAQTTADGKNKIYRQATSPALTGNAVGDLWFDTGNDNRISRWDGSSWVQYGLGNAAIANLDAGKITTGSLDAGRIAANTINASMIVAGAITGTKIAADAIDGKTITGATLQTSNTAAGKIIIDSTNGFRAIASNGVTTVQITTAGTASFNGSVTATSFSATGLVTSSDLQANSVTSTQIATSAVGSTEIADLAITNAKINDLSASKINAGTINAAVISVTNLNASNITTGTIDASSISVTNLNASNLTAGTISAVAINIGTGTFAVTSTGALTATSATITGTVRATSGYIGDATNGWNFSSQGYMYNNDFSTILYPKGTLSNYALITSRAVSANAGFQMVGADSVISMTGTVVPSLLVGAVSCRVYSNWTPSSDAGYNCGTSNYRWGTVYASNGTINTSDGREKTDVRDASLGLDFIKALRPISFRWIVGTRITKKNENGELIRDENGNVVIEELPGKRRHWGFIAQEVKQVLDQYATEDFAGWVIHDVDDPDSRQSLSYTNFIAPIVKAIQELADRVEALETT